MPNLPNLPNLPSCLLLLSALVSACTGDDSSTVSDTTASEATTSTPSASDSSTTDTLTSSSSSSSSSPATDTDADTDSSSSSGGGPLDFPPVACGESTCLDGQICLKDGIDCDISEMPPEWITPPPVCADVPDPCPEAGPDELVDCLGEALCTAYEAAFGAQLKDGTLECPPVALDCF